jgi:DNA invertase Pin-like site-specific DNA recombinase
LAKIGYARVSDDLQSYETQQARLRTAGCEIVRAEKVSGKSRDGRDELASIVKFIRCGFAIIGCPRQSARWNAP